MDEFFFIKCLDNERIVKRHKNHGDANLTNLKMTNA